MAAEALEDRVLAELLALRKMSSGVNVDTLAGTRVICDLLGGGDPFVAYTRLCHEILDSDLDLSVKAAAASLGLLAEGDTRLKRLDAFGAEIRMEQRQVRRYSDRGVRVIARLISSNWPTETVPNLTAVLVLQEDLLELHLSTSWLRIVVMDPVEVTLLQGDCLNEIVPIWTVEERQRWCLAHTTEPLLTARIDTQTSIRIVWPGELWPKFTVVWVGKCARAVSESLGNKLMVRVE